MAAVKQNQKPAVDVETGEIVDTTVNASTGSASVAAHRGATVKTKSGMKFKVTKVVTVPVLKLMPDSPVYILVQSAMRKSKEIKNAARGAQPMEPATVMDCVDLQNDGECILIVGKVLEGVIDEMYPAGAYVGKRFEIINHGKRGDKKYNSYSVNEVEVDDSPDEPAKNGDPAATA